jgi:hypothetical protein
MQTKLQQWAMAYPGGRFDDLANLVYDAAFLVVAWSRVRATRAREPPAGRFGPQQVREKTIPRPDRKVRSLGIPTTTDRVVQAALKLVLDPIFEAGFQPCSSGFRPRRRAQDAIAEIPFLASPTRSSLGGRRRRRGPGIPDCRLGKRTWPGLLLAALLTYAPGAPARGWAFGRQGVRHTGRWLKLG